jgi:lathosterol oxidase
MDFVLEIFDGVMFDRMYANLLPRDSAFSAFDPSSTITAGFKGLDNSTFDSATAGVDVLRSTWQFEPASQYMSVQPSEFAYMSRWDRDNVWRQTISLYILTWYVAELLCIHDSKTEH